MKHSRSCNNALTLVELIVTMTLIVLVAGATGAMLRSFGSARDRIERHTSTQQEARAGMDAIVSALRSASRTAGPEGVLEGTSDQQGDLPSDRIRFFTVSDQPVRPGEAESDFRECEFFLAPGDAAQSPSLARRLDPTRNDTPDGGGVVEHIADRVAGLEFRYHDGTSWRNDWPLEMASWPTAISVRMLIVPSSLPGQTNNTGGLIAVGRIVNFPYRGQAQASAAGSAAGSAATPSPAGDSSGSGAGLSSPEVRQ